MSTQTPHRFPRVGNNSKNNSHDIFGGCLDYQKGAAERYDRTSVAELEKRAMQQKRQFEAVRTESKRKYIADLEQKRWSKMAQEYCKKEQDWLNRHAHSKIGKSSVNYNPITMEYHKDSGGLKLSQDDAKSLYRTSIRAANLYLKQNTFDPLRCQDIPRRIVVDPTSGGQPTIDSASNPTELEVPKRLAQVAAQRAYIVKTKVNHAEKVFHAENARIVNGKNGVAAAGTARALPSEDTRPVNPEAIVVEMDGNGRNQHSWTRHC